MKEIQGVLNQIPQENTIKRGQPAGGKEDFEKLLAKSLNEVNRLQMESDKAVQELAAGRRENVHETMIAMEKASVSFQMMMQIRNKIIEAYQEIMKSSM